MDKKEFLRQKREIENSEAKDKTGKLISSAAGFVSGLPIGEAYDRFTTIFPPKYVKRRDEWLSILMFDFIQREEKGLLTMEDLADNEEFVTIVTKATLLAQQNHQKEKINAFRAIVNNSVEWLQNGNKLFDWAEYFLRVVDELSPLHLLILNVFHAPKSKEQELGKDLSSYSKMSSHTLFCELYPNLKDRSSLIKQCWKDLYRYGFVKNDDMTVGIHGDGKYQKLTNDFGDKFLDMITYKEL